MYVSHATALLGGTNPNSSLEKIEAAIFICKSSNMASQSHLNMLAEAASSATSSAASSVASSAASEAASSTASSAASSAASEAASSAASSTASSVASEMTKVETRISLMSVSAERRYPVTTVVATSTEDDDFYGKTFPGFNKNGDYVDDAPSYVLNHPDVTGRYGMGSYLLLVNVLGGEPRFAVSKRSLKSSFRPGSLDFAASGFSLDIHESSYTTIIRNAETILGLQFKPNHLTLSFRCFIDNGYKRMSDLFLVGWDNSYIPFNKNLIEDLQWMTAKELTDAATSGVKMIPDLRTYVLSKNWPPVKKFVSKSATSDSISEE